MPTLAHHLRALGYLDRAPAADQVGPDTATVTAALARWAGVENLEERLRDDAVDRTVLGFLRERAARADG